MTEWERIVGRHGPAVWQTAYRLLGNRDEAADCYGQTFLAALEVARRQKVRNYGGLLRWLCTCRAMDRLRKRARQAGREEGSADWSNVASANPGPMEEAQAAELSQRLRRALVKLPGQEAEVFCLRCLSELSYRDIGKQLGLKTSTVGVLLHRARGRLREALGRADGAQDAEVQR